MGQFITLPGRNGSSATTTLLSAECAPRHHPDGSAKAHICEIKFF